MYVSYIKSSTIAEAGVNGIVSTYTAQKMVVAYMFMRHRVRQRERVFQDRTHPLEEYDDIVYQKFQFHRQFIF